MVFALTAPIIAFLVYTKKMLSRKVIIIWNYIGLMALASVIVLFLKSIYKPEMYGSATPLLPLAIYGIPVRFNCWFSNASGRISACSFHSSGKKKLIMSSV